MGIANITNNILTDSGILTSSLPSGSGVTNELTYWTSSSVISSLTTATYPSLTELSYVKGITSSVQTQLNAKQDTLNGTGFVKAVGTTISYDNSTYLTANQSITLSGAVTGTGTTAITTTLANSIVGVANLSATGTPDSTTYLRGDNTWATVAGGSMAIGGSITSATAGSVLFAGASGVLQQDNANFFWDDTNNRLGIGTNAPAGRFDAQFNQAATSNFYFRNTDSSVNNARTHLNIQAGTLTLEMKVVSNSSCTIAPSAFSTFNLGAIGGSIQLYGNGITGFSSSGSEKARITAAGRLLLGTTTEETYILDVFGTSRFQNELLVSLNQNAQTLLTISNTTSGTASQSRLILTSDSLAGSGTLSKKSNTFTTSGIINLADLAMVNSSKGDIVILNSVATGAIKFAAGGSSTAQVTLSSAGNLTQSVNQNAATNLNISNTTSGTASESQLILTSDLTAGSGNLSKKSNTFTASGIINLADLVLRNDTKGDIVIFNNFASGVIDFASGASATVQMSLLTTGQLALKNYTTSTSFSGTAAGYLGFDSSGNVLSIAVPSAPTTVGYTLQATAAALANFTWADATQYYIGAGIPTAQIINQGRGEIYVPKTGTITSAYVYASFSTAGSAEAWSMSILVNGVTATVIQSITVSATTRVWSNTALSIAVSVGDHIEIRSNAVNWATNPVSNTGYGINASIYIQ